LQRVEAVRVPLRQESANRTSLDEAAQITGLTADQIRQSAEWIAQPKQSGARRRTMFSYEKGLIWGNDNYRTNGALVNVALATGNIGRPGGGCVRMGGHQEGYSRPSDAHVGRPAAYVDKLLIEGKGGVHHIWGCDHYKTTLNALKFKQAYPTTSAKRKQTFLLFAYPTGVQGNVVSPGVNEFIIPNYKQTWGWNPKDRGCA
jgi:arsenite oxidase large subunit